MGVGRDRDAKEVHYPCCGALDLSTSLKAKSLVEQVYVQLGTFRRRDTIQFHDRNILSWRAMRGRVTVTFG